MQVTDLQGFEDGAPGEIRTPDRSVRSRVLYPAELQALNSDGDSTVVPFRLPVYLLYYSVLERLRNTSLYFAPAAGLWPSSGAALKRVQIRMAHGCAGVAKHTDVRERPPGEFVELPTARFVAEYSIQLTPGA